MIDKDDQNKIQGEGALHSTYENTDNDYGLPEAEYSPIEREQPLIPDDNISFHSAPSEEPEQPQNRSGWILWAGLGLILCLAGIFVYFLLFDDAGNTETIAQNPVQDASPAFMEEPEPVEEEPFEDNWVPAEPEVTEGSVSSISSRTGKYYLIVGSFIDSDLARDYGQKLAKEGISSKIIEPSGTRKFYRLSVKDAESVEELNTELDSMRSKFGENVWIVKY